jgi:PAS domain S-box-containing protein
MDTLEKITSCKKDVEDPFCQLILKMPVMLVIFTRDGKTIFGNEVLISVTGYKKEELFNRNWKETLYPGDENSRRINALLDRVDVGDVYDYEIDLRHKDGHYVPVLWSITKLGRFDGQAEVYLKFGIDITRRTKAEKELRKNEQQFRQLADLAEEGVYVHDGRKIVNANKKAYKMFGYEYHEFMEVTDLKKLFTHKSFETIVQKYSERVEGTYDVEGIKKDGTIFPVQLTVRNFPIDEENLRVIILRDLTDIKKAEEDITRERDLFSTIVETSPVGILMFNEEGRIIFANDFAEEKLRLKMSEIPEIMYDEPHMEVTDCSGKPVSEDEKRLL